MRRGPRLLASPLSLHDVRDVEAHVRVLLDARLGEWGARLDVDLYNDALTYLLNKCWELSGLDDGGRPRRVWYVRLFWDLDHVDAPDGRILGPFRDEAEAQERACTALDVELEEGEQAQAELYEGPPPGAYDPALGLTFSTYSRRILAARVVDWYRHTFGDARYARRAREVSLDAIAERYDAGGEAPEQFLDALMPVHDPTDEVLTRVALRR